MVGVHELLTRGLTPLRPGSRSRRRIRFVSASVIAMWLSAADRLVRDGEPG